MITELDNKATHCQPHARQHFLAFGVDTQRQENSFVDYAAILAGLHDNAVHINNGIQRVQLPVLPLSDLLLIPEYLKMKVII